MEDSYRVWVPDFRVLVSSSSINFFIFFLNPFTFLVLAESRGKELCPYQESSGT